MTDWRLLLTRSAPDCQEQEKQLQALGISCECLPLIEITSLPETDSVQQKLLNFKQYTSIVVVSKAAAKLVLEKLANYYPELPNHQPWFTVGKATAELLKKAGLNTFTPTTGDDSEALWQLTDFQQQLKHPNPRILIVKGIGGRNWLIDELQAESITTHSIDLYKRSSPDYPPEILLKTIIMQKINGIVVSSGQGLHNLHNLSKQDWIKLINIPLFVPSERVKKQAQELGMKHIINCKGADLPALISALKVN